MARFKKLRRASDRPGRRLTRRGSLRERVEPGVADADMDDTSTGRQGGAVVVGEELGELQLRGERWRKRPREETSDEWVGERESSGSETPMSTR